MIQLVMGINGEIDSGAVDVDNAASWVDVCRVQAAGRPCTLSMTVGAAGGLGGLQISQEAVLDGPETVVAEDEDFATLADGAAPVAYVLYDTTLAGPHLTAAGDTVQLQLDGGAACYVIRAKKASADTTLRVRGRIL